MDNITTFHPGIIKLNKTVIIGDPCYSASGCETIKNMLPGIYHTAIRNCDGRVSRLIAVHKKYSSNPALDAESPDELDSYFYTKSLTSSEEYIGVDSGQAGIYDKKYFLQNEKDRDYDNLTSWYRRICDTTDSEEGGGIMDSRCVVSRSGYGDGSYACTLFREKTTQSCVAIVIDYEIETEEENYYDEYEEDEEN